MCPIGRQQNGEYEHCHINVNDRGNKSILIGKTFDERIIFYPRTRIINAAIIAFFLVPVDQTSAVGTENRFFLFC